MGRKPTNSIPVFKSLHGAQGIKRMKSVSDLEKETGLSEWEVRGTVNTVKKMFKEKNWFLRNTRLGSRKTGNFKSGYFIVRLNNGKDILPPENDDFNAIKRRFGSFLELWQNVDWKSLKPKEKDELINMQNEMVKVIANW